MTKKKEQKPLEITLKSTADITLEQLKFLDDEGETVYIRIKDDKNNAMEQRYTVEEFYKIKEGINKFLAGCPQKDENNNDPDIEKKIFTYIYLKLALMYNFDSDAVEYLRNGSEIFKICESEYLNQAQNLYGVFVRETALNGAYIEALRNLLAEKGIIANSIYIERGRGEDISKPKVRIWNTFFLDKEWYYCEFLTDKDYLKKNCLAPNFLKSYSDYLTGNGNLRKENGETNGLFPKGEPTRSVSGEYQGILIKTYREQILEELKPPVYQKRKSSFDKLKGIFSRNKKTDNGVEEKENEKQQ